MRLLSIFVLATLLAACKFEQPPHLIYFGFVTHKETPEDVKRMVEVWGQSPICPHWRTTPKREEADFQLLFGGANVTLTDRRGQVLYSGGTGPLYFPNGGLYGSGVNLCKLTGE